MSIVKTYPVVAVHGEGSRDHLVKLQIGLLATRGPLPDISTIEVTPDVVLVLRDVDGHHSDVPIKTWPEVEELKKLVGWDPELRHWGKRQDDGRVNFDGVTIKVTYG